ncbi:MAG: tetratricopeptide repeat protein [Nannocystaceae bacterium]|nr:tetratricopeptide repeat protein [Nannocystaceae bacterium]
MVATRLDAYAQRWRRHAALACLPVGARGDALRSCLSSAAVAYGHAIALLRDGQERTVRRTASVLARLPSPEACFRSPGGGVEQGPVADALRARLARVQNLQIVAQTRDAYALALETYELAGASHLPRLEARAALAIAISAPTTGEESPKQWLHRAHELAVACGDDHIATGASLSLISEHVRRRDFDGARRWIRHAEGYLGETGHPRQRATLNARIGHLHRAEGDLDQALEYARKVLEAYVDFDGPHSLEASKSRVAFGHALLAAGRYEEAKVPLETAIADLVPKFGETHAVVATACNGRGGASYFLGEYATAVKYYERSIAIRRDLNGRDSLQVATLESNLGGVLTDRGDHTAAIATLRHANAVMTEHYGPDDLRLVDVWLNLGRALSIAGHDEAGLKILWRAATLYEGRGDATATQRGLIDLNLGEAYERQARIATAVEHYVRAHELFRTRLGDDHPNTKEAADALARIQRP